MTNCFIINFNRLLLPKRMVEYLRQVPEINPIIIDNNSTYEPLLQWYSEKPCEIERMSLNWSNCVFWQTSLMEKYEAEKGNYIVTDSDLILDKIPLDFMDVLREGLEKYPDVDKCGFSLEIENLPPNDFSAQVISGEGWHWREPLEGGRFYRAAIDTTFSLFRGRIHSFNCIRTGRPYIAEHPTWSYTKDNLPEDEKYYLTNTNTRSNDWTTRLRTYLEI